MTNKEKARALFKSEIGNLNVPDFDRELEILTAIEAMAEWKDRQFKEYLGKKKGEYMLKRDDANMWSEEWAVFHALTCTMHQIINELFV